LAALAEAGITLTFLAPHQARRIRPLGAGDAAWTPVTPESLDVRRLYRCLLPGGGFVDVLFRHAALSHGVAFGALLGDGVQLAKRLRAALETDGSIVAIAVDGETYGHHHRFGEMALAAALRGLRNETAILYETRAGEVLHDPWEARDGYVECVLDPGRTAGFLAAEANGRLSPAASVLARRALELARHALLMQTSCGWFFDDLAGLEPVQVMRYAARTIELAETLGRRLEDGFADRL